MAKTTADLLVERLMEWGIDTIFGFPGDGVNGIFEALRTNQEKIRFITDQFIKFSEALLKGQKDALKILKTVMKDKIREVV